MKRICSLVFFLVTFLHLGAQTTLPAVWSFVNPSPTEDSLQAPVGWKTRLNIAVSGTTPYTYAAGSDGNAACRLDGTGEYVQVWFAEIPGPVTYYIRGTGISPNPPFAGSFNVQESTDGVNWNDMRVLTSLTGSFVKYTNLPASTSRYVRFFYAQKQSGSNIALDSIKVSKAPPRTSATITVRNSGKALVNGTTYVNGTIGSSIFTVRNGGTQEALNISGITVTGTNAGDYSVGTYPSSIAPGDSANITVTFNPAAQGTRRATITIMNNDSDNAAFSINMYGIGGSYASEPSVQPATLTFGNIRPYTFNVIFAEPAQKPENYIVLRKQGTAVAETPVDGITYKRGDFIGSAQVAYIGSANSFKPAYILAGSNYQFAVFAFNGPSSYENYLTTSPLTGSINTPAGNAGNYYSGINPLVSTFVSSLGQRINPHDTIFYGNFTPTMINEFLTKDTTGGRKVVYCVYTSIPYIYNEPFIWWGNGTGGQLTREHTFAQSWMPSNQGNSNWPNAPGGSRELPEYNDQHNLFPANQTQANNVRSNHPFGEVVNITSQNGEGKLGTDRNGKTVYEPRDAQKGDLARALFYMSVAYHGVGGRSWALGAVNGGKQNDSILKVWHTQDPPDKYEIARHEYIYSIQRNRNPFIDHPSWVNYINFNNMSYITDTLPPPTLSLMNPDQNSIWKKNENVTIKWNATRVDTVYLFFSSDSLKTFESMGHYSARPDSVQLTYNYTRKSMWGRVIIMDPMTGLSDTSDYFSLQDPSSLRDHSPENGITVYPNPVNGGVLRITNNAGAETEVVLYSISGSRLQSSVFIGASEINMENYSPGIYMIRIKYNDKVQTYKIMKQ